MVWLKVIRCVKKEFFDSISFHDYQPGLPHPAEDVGPRSASLEASTTIEGDKGVAVSDAC
jgi:hypothetical protein